ncbi:MAG: AI-2E family transporter [Proteobacteria bacterium]|nr:AI-2E family transporter [Pseudomonadota bacterium]
MSDETEGKLLRQGFTVVVVALIVIGTAVVLAPLRQPLAWAAVLAFLLQPVQHRLTTLLRGRATTAAGLITALTPLLLLLPLMLLGIAFARQVSALLTALQANPQLWSIDAWRDPLLHPRLNEMLMWIQSRLNLGPQDLYDQLYSVAQNGIKLLAGTSGRFVLDAASTLLEFGLMLFILFFMLCDGPTWVQRVALLLPLSAARRDLLLDRTAKVTRAVVFGTGLTAVGQGALVGIGFAITGLQGAVVFGVIATLLSLLPVGGAVLVWLPAAAWLLFDDQIGWALFMLVWGGFLSTADNFVRPALISHQTPVSTLLVFLGVIGGIAAFGFIGFIAGPVILVLATQLLRFAEPSRDSAR